MGRGRDGGWPPSLPRPTNGIVERLHRTILDEFYRVAFRKKIYSSIEALQDDLDAWLEDYNLRRPVMSIYSNDSPR